MKIKKILVPVDFSENSLNALRYAAAFAKSPGAGIFILHVSDNTQLDDEMRGNLAPDHLMNLLREEPYLSDLKITTMVMEGSISDLILSESEKNDMDLVVMGTLGAGSVARRLVGTNTTKVVGKSKCAVLAVPAEATFNGIRKAIIAVDLDQRTDKLINEIIMMLKNTTAEILLTYVGHDPDGTHEHELERLTLSMIQSSGYERLQHHLIQSSEFPMSLESFALDIEAGLLVMITHHRGIFESIFDPSETQLYAYHTSVPLMVIPHHRKPVFFL